MKNRAPEIDEFMTLFKSVKEQCRDSPSRIDFLVENGPRFEDLTKALHWCAYTLRLAERRDRELFIENVAPDFRAAWRDFEGRYVDLVDPIRHIKGPIIIDVDTGFSVDATKPRRKSRQEIWEEKDQVAERFAEGLSDLINSQVYRLDNRTGKGGSRTEADWQQVEGLEGLSDLVRGGLDLRGIHRRRALCPIFLLPIELRDSLNERSYPQLLQSTQEAFVLGAFQGAIALLRANKDQILKRIPKKYRSVASYPDARVVATLERLKKLADDLLHGNIDAKIAYPENTMEFEIELIEFLGAVRALVERPMNEAAE